MGKNFIPTITHPPIYFYVIIYFIYILYSPFNDMHISVFSIYFHKYILHLTFTATPTYTNTIHANTFST